MVYKSYFFRRPKQLISLRNCFLISTFSENNYFWKMQLLKDNKSLIKVTHENLRFESTCNYNQDFFIALINNGKSIIKVDEDFNYEFLIKDFPHFIINQSLKFSSPLNSIIFSSKNNNDIYLFNIQKSEYNLIASSKNIIKLKSIKIKDIIYSKVRKSFIILDNLNNNIYELDLKRNILKVLIGSGREGKGFTRNPSSIIEYEDKFILFDTDNYFIQFYDSNFNWINQIGGKGNSLDSLDMALSGTLNDNNLLISDSNNDRIKIFDIKESICNIFISSEYKKGILKRPLKIVENINGDLYVADRDNNCIQIFDSNFNYKFSIALNGKRSSFRPSALGVINYKDTNFLYILDRPYKLKPRILLFINHTYSKVINFKSILKDPQDMHITNSGIILIADTLNRRIYVINKYSEFEIDLTKYSFNKRILVRSITFDEYKQEIIVIDFESSQILHFDIDGKFKSSFVPPDHLSLKYVRGLSIYDDDYFFTSRSNKSIVRVDKKGNLKEFINKEYFNKSFLKNPSQILRRNSGDYLVVDKESDRIVNFDKNFKFKSQFGFPQEYS